MSNGTEHRLVAAACVFGAAAVDWNDDDHWTKHPVLAAARSVAQAGSQARLGCDAGSRGRDARLRWGALGRHRPAWRRLFTVVFTIGNDDFARVISLRRATSREIESYESQGRK